MATRNFPGGSDGEVSACNTGDLGSIPGLGRSTGEGNWLPTPVFWAGESHELYNPWGHKESDTTEQLSLSSERKKTKLIAASHLRGAEQP